MTVATRSEALDDVATAATDWVRATAHRVVTTDPRAPLDDLAVMGPMLAGAVVIGLGESVRGARRGRELYRLKHRILRFAVEELGCRTMALEERDDPVGTALDDHVRTGAGDLRALLATAWGPWRTAELHDVVAWLRAYNAGHGDDPVRIVGVDGDEPGALARNTLAWHDWTGDKIVYWGGLAHVAVGAGGPHDGQVFRDQLGPAYRAVGVVCHHGVGAEVLPPPPAHFAESILAAAAGVDDFVLDLREAHPPEVAAWLHSPTATRVIGPRYDPDDDASYCLSGGSLAGWFDLVAHVRDITPARPLDPAT